MLEGIKIFLSIVIPVLLILSIAVLILKFTIFMVNIIPTDITLIVALISLLFVKIVLKGE